MSENELRQYFSERVILAARNVDVDSINNAVLQRLSDDSKVYVSADSAFNDAGVINDAIPNEYLNTITVPGMPLHQTVLKLNSPIILLRNLNHYESLCNGTRMMVTAMAERVIEAQILAGTHAGKKAFILRRRQLPIRLGYSMSINKAQGQSLHRVGINLNNPVFAHGQLYVALSSCTDYQNLCVLLPSNANGKTPNIVYSEVIH